MFAVYAHQQPERTLRAVSLPSMFALNNYLANQELSETVLTVFNGGVFPFAFANFLSFLSLPPGSSNFGSE